MSSGDQMSPDWKWVEGYKDMRAELSEILRILKSTGPCTETLFTLAQRGTARRIEELMVRYGQ